MGYFHASVLSFVAERTCQSSLTTALPVATCRKQDPYVIIYAHSALMQFVLHD